MDVVTRAWTREERDLWHRIEGHAFENPTIDLDFARRLARTLGWSLDHTRAGLEEYRRFCFLACVTTGAPVTPSEEVDEIWHLHLTYTRDYWDRWCGEALGRKLHHDPTMGGPVEQSRYRAQYADTLALYESWFGPPPAAFWPSTNKRFAARPRFRMIDGDQSFVVPRLRSLKLATLSAIFVLGASPASAADAWNPLDLNGPDFLLLYVVLAMVAVSLTLATRPVVLATGRTASVDGLTPIEAAFVEGGDARAADTLFLSLAAHGVAHHTDNRVTIDGASTALPTELEAYRRELHGTHFRKRMIELFARSDAAAAMKARLQRRNLVLSPTRKTWLELVNATPICLVVAFGAMKIAVGMSRHKPVLFLMVLCLATLIGFGAVVHRERYITRAGRAALDALRAKTDRAIRAPRTEELALAFAFGGAAVLAGTEYEAYAKVARSQPDGSGSGCSTSTSGCSGGGSGCGGGGCGGCGS